MNSNMWNATLVQSSARALECAVKISTPVGGSLTV
jgi:hypothetical protein